MKATLFAAIVTTATAVVAASAPAPAPPSSDDLARLAFKNDLLQKRFDLASSKEFYLVLDPAQKSMSLMYKAALLQSYAVEGLEVGVPQVLYKSRSDASGWESKVWHKGALDPVRELDRVEVVAPPPTAEGTEIEVQVPQTPEEKYPVPPRYHIRFEGGLSIEVRPPGSDAEGGFWARLGQRWNAWWADAKAASSGDNADTVRLHVVMSKKDADSLYRALPPNTALLVVPPSP
ncbi:MAG TPA: hypothetical protein VFV19_04505 [Candidatus Polarisedimenticolaceae bacterium]|nr:hypothetical protein [Candidatus Polarisedimenticolaceae bacterium]